jgi:hypothetical protein
MSPLWDLMDYLTPFLMGWEEFMDMFLELLCWFTILFLWYFFWFFLCWFLESLSPFFSNNHTRSFLRAYISWHASYGDTMASFMNQILHLANPHDKLSALCVSKSWVLKYSLTNPLRSKTQTSLSLFTCRMDALGWRTWTLMISIFCLEWLRYRWFSISLFMDFDSPYYSVTSSLTL